PGGQGSFSHHRDGNPPNDGLGRARSAPFLAAGDSKSPRRSCPSQGRPVPQAAHANLRPESGLPGGEKGITDRQLSAGGSGRQGADMQELGKPTTDAGRRRVRRTGPTIGRHGRGKSSANRHLLGSNHRLLGGIFGSGDSSPGDASANRRISGKKQGDDMSLSVGSSKLNDALKELRARWEDTRARWQDEVAQDFEDHYWQPLEIQVQATLRGLDQLTQELA